MISSLHGTVASSTGTACVLEVGGVGFLLHVTPGHSAKLRVGEQASVVTTLIVRDDALVLFGFENREYLETFDLLRSVPGVGPKSAMAVLSVLTPGDVATAVADDDDRVFQKVPGIGQKTAKLLVVHLAGKVDAVVSRATGTGGGTAVAGDVVAALVELGWSQKTATAAVERIIDKDGSVGTVAELLRLALAELGPRR